MIIKLVRYWSMSQSCIETTTAWCLPPFRSLKGRRQAQSPPPQAHGRSSENHVTHPTWCPPIGRYNANALLVRPITRPCTIGRCRSKPRGQRARPRGATSQAPSLAHAARSSAALYQWAEGARRRKMARSAAAVVAMAVAVLLAAALHGPAAAAQKKPPTAARREDIPYIRCQVCERIAREISAQVAKKQAALPPAKKVPEIEIIEIAENVCNLKKQEADWMLRIDIVEKGDKLELVEQDEEGHCNSECKTIERACQEVLGYADTDIAEFVYKNKPSVDQLVKFLCKDLSKACAMDPPPVPKNRVPGELFAAKPSKDAEMEKILKSMEGMPGAPNMKMYSRDDLMKNNFGAEDDDEDDDDDVEDNFPKNLGKVLKDKVPQKSDLKQQAVKQIKDTSKKLKGHVNKVSKVVKNWWRGKKQPTKSSKTEL